MLSTGAQGFYLTAFQYMIYGSGVWDKEYGGV